MTQKVPISDTGTATLGISAAPAAQEQQHHQHHQAHRDDQRQLGLVQ